MNLNKQLLELLLSQDEEDCRLGFEICKKKKIRVKELNQFENSQLKDNHNHYFSLPIYRVICDYLDWSDRHTKWYKWQKNKTIQ